MDNLQEQKVSLHGLSGKIARIQKNILLLACLGVLLIETTNCGNSNNDNFNADQHDTPSTSQTTSDSEDETQEGGRLLSPGMTWQWQLTGTIDTSYDVDMYDIDLFDVSESTIAQLHADGRIVIGYFSAGSWEDWRSDADQFPDSVKGKDLDGWPGEKWLDIRNIDALAPIMRSRMDLAVQKGCDGIEPDNVDGYVNDSGFSLSYSDQRSYNIWLANEAHTRGLSIALKNDLEQIDDLEPYFDWALNEQCFEYDECEKLLPFIQAGKGVFGVEYELKTDAFCSQANAWNFSWLRKNWDLDDWQESCASLDPAP